MPIDYSWKTSPAIVIQVSRHLSVATAYIDDGCAGERQDFALVLSDLLGEPRQSRYFSDLY